MKSMSKAEMARRLQELGVKLSFNTLRKYSHELLVGMLEQSERLGVVPAMPEASVKELGNSVETVDQAMERIVAADLASCPHCDKPDCNVNHLATYIPSDAEIMRAAQPLPAPVQSEARPSSWMALVLSPWMMLKGLCGM